MLNQMKNRIHRTKEKSRRLLGGRESSGSVDQAPSISSQELVPANPHPARPPPNAEPPHADHLGHNAQINLTPAVSVPTNMEPITLSSPEPAEANVPSTYMSTTTPATLEAMNQPNPDLTTKPDLQTRKHTAWSGLSTLLSVLNQCTKAFEPLKSAFDGFSQCIEIFENVAVAREEYTQLRAELDSIFLDISGFLNGNAPPLMTSSIETLARGIEKETERVAHKLRRDRMGQYAEATEDVYEVLECYRRIQVLLNRLSLNANTNMWRIVDEQATQNRLDRLPYSAEAKYLSAQSDSLGRNACTPNTRVDVLEQLRAWAQNDDNQNIYWLNGMAGTGKTTIAYSLCEELQGAGKLAASFFCSRQLPSCRDVNRILPSIAYQLASLSRPFRHELSSVLESSSDAHNQTVDLQFDSLIAAPLRAVQKALPVDMVIVIDALDECEDSDGVGKMLLALLQHALDIPIRVFVTSRPDQQILDRMESEKYKHLRSELRLHELKHSEVQTDIRTYLTVFLDGVVLSATDLDKLIIQSGVLFIYASTIVRYLTYDPTRSGERLKKLLSMSASSGLGQQGIDTLYTTILQAALENKNLDSEEQRQINQVLRMVICAQEPLPVDTIARLLGASGVGSVHAALRPLSSILQVSNTTDQLVTTLHQSFPDYMLDQKRSGRYYCQPEEHNAWYTRTCFDLIETTIPSFNICRIESSYVPNREIVGLGNRIDEAISSQLFYACRYWEAHAELVDPPREVADQIVCFLSTRPLLWMEIMSLKQSLNDGVSMLLRLQAWLLRIQASSETQELAVDALRFVTAYASGPTSQLTPHIYLTTLVLWPKQRPISKLYLERFPQLAEASGTAIGRRGAAALAVLSAPGRVCSVACSPDGTRIASGSSDHAIHIWDAYTGRTIGWPLKGHTGDVLCVAFSPDGERTVSGSSDNVVYIWGTNNGQTLGQTLQGHANAVSSVAYSPNGLYIVSGSSDNTVRIWDSRRGQALGGPLEGHTGPVLSVAYSSDNAYIVSGSADKTIRIWDAKTRTQLGKLMQEHVSAVYSVAFSPSDFCVVSGSADGTIRIWDAKTGQALGQPLQGHTSLVLSVTYSPNGAYIASGSEDNTICIWEARSGQMLGQPLRGHTGWIRSIAFSPDGLRIISGSHDKTIRIWDAHIGQTSGQPPEGHTGGVHSVAYSPDGARIVSGSEDRTICIWDASTGRMIGQPLKGHTDNVNSVAYSHDGTRIVSGSYDGTVRIWDASSGQMVGQPLEGHSKCVFSVMFSPDGSRIVSDSEDNSICIWDASSGQMVGQPLEGHSKCVFSVMFSPDGSRIVSGSEDNSICIWDAHVGQMVGQPVVYSVTFSPDGAHIVSGSEDQTICIWDANTGQTVGQPLKGHSDRVRSVAYSPSGTHIVSGSDDKTFRIWDASTGQMVGQPLEGHTSGVRSVAYSPDGARIVSGSVDMTIRIWNAYTGQMLGQPLEGHTSSVWSVAYSPDGKHIVSGSWDKSIRIWDVSALPNSGKAFQDNSDPARQHPSSPDIPVSISDDSNHSSPIYKPQTECGFPIRPNLSGMCSIPCSCFHRPLAHGSVALFLHYNPDPNAWTLSEDGWVVGHDLKPLLWVPPELRGTLIRYGNERIISVEGSWSLDLSKGKFGTDWQQCYCP